MYIFFFYVRREVCIRNYNIIHKYFNRLENIYKILKQTNHVPYYVLNKPEIVQERFY